MANFTFDDVLKQIESLQDSSPDGFTVAEMSEAIGVGEDTCRKKIRVLKNKGLVEFAGHKSIEGIDDKLRPIPVYRLINEKE